MGYRLVSRGPDRMSASREKDEELEDKRRETALKRVSLLPGDE